MTKKITVKKHNDSYFYKATEVIDEHYLTELYDSAVYWLENTRKDITEEVYPPEASAELFSYPEFVNSDLWKMFYNAIKTHIAKYCEITGIKLSSINIHSSWITRIADIEFGDSYIKGELRKRLRQHNALGNMHSHIDNPIGMVFYLKNPDPKYGTIVKLSDKKIFHNDGEENSLLIFDPQLYHTALYPSISVSEKYPRITIVVDCSYKT